MFGPFAEAVRASTQPCTFLLVVPTLVAVAATRFRWASLAAVLGSAVVGGWWFAANRIVLDGWGLRVSAVVVVAALGAGLWVDRSDGVGRRHVWPAPALAGLVALVATQWWRPCVGEELGAILNRASTDLLGQLPAMTAYMLGAMVPAVIAVLLARTLQPDPRLLSASSAIAGVVGVTIAGALVLGRHDDVVVTLTRWTLD